MEGVVSSLPTVLTTWLGLYFGLVLVNNPGDHRARLRHLSIMSTVCFVFGWVLNFWWRMNKQIWNPAYLFFMAGSCA